MRDLKRNFRLRLAISISIHDFSQNEIGIRRLILASPSGGFVGVKAPGTTGLNSELRSRIPVGKVKCFDWATDGNR